MKIKNYININYTVKVLVLLLGSCLCLMLVYILFSKLDIKDENGLLKLSLSGFGAIVTICITFINTHEDKNRELALHYITEKRIDWINDTRHLTARLCKSIWQYINLDNYQMQSSAGINIYGDIGEMLSELYMRYNINGERDRILLAILINIYKYIGEYNEACKDIINPLEKNKAKRQLKKAIKLLTMHSQIYLKIEWDRIKDETSFEGNINMRRKIIRKKMVRKRRILYKASVNYYSSFNEGLHKLTVHKYYQDLKR